MCGINGFNFVNEELANAMNNEIIHRGPDNQSVWANEKFTFGHLRLSIIDISSAGNQPFHYKTIENSYTIVFNGEIYNYIEIKEILKIKGYTFNTQSDTEVILAAYDFWGELCVNQFNGMWAFCIFDHIKQKLFCSRDRLGVKPFYYYFKDGIFIFSSELKAILKHEKLKINSKSNINNEALNLYFSTGIIPAPYTIYNNTFKLKSSHNLWFDLNSKELYIYRYYTPQKQSLIHNKSDLFVEFKELFESSIQLRMRSDVPVGSFLSGGIDSTGIVYGILKNQEIKEFHTFSVGFEGKFDETKFINLACKPLQNISHQHEYYTKEMWQNDENNYTFVYDEPFSDYSGFPTMHVSKMARKNATVVQSGDGGDEIFGGYPTYNRALAVEKLMKMPMFVRAFLNNSIKNLEHSKLRSIKEALKLSKNTKQNYLASYLVEERSYSNSYKNWTIDNLNECLELTNGVLPEALRMFDTLYYSLSDRYLAKVDKASMFNSIEVRSPFLDYRFIDYSLKIPMSYKYNLNDSKILLKDFLEDYLPKIPKEILRRKKQGFTPPLRDWIKSDLFIEEFNENLEIMETIDENLYKYYLNINLYNSTTGELESLIRFKIFINWYKKWISNN
jgi:asparagine synthase (glutamine-hydrolysing)